MRHSGLKRLLIVAFFVMELPHVCVADDFTHGNFILSEQNGGSGPGRIREFTLSGTQVQTFTIPAVGDEGVRDSAIDRLGRVHIFNGTFTPFLSTLNPVSGTINNTTVSGWSTVNNGTYGGVATYGNYVFVSDMFTFNGGEPNGIIRFNVVTFANTRFGSGVPDDVGDNIDITVGRDGLLYALRPGGSPSGRNIDVYNPETLAFVRSVTTNSNLRAITVDSNGDIYGVHFNDVFLYRFNANMTLLDSINTGGAGYADIDINDNGQILASRGGTTVLTDRALDSFSVINTGSLNFTTFASWVQPVAGVPEPGTIAFLAICIAVACGACWYRWRRFKQQYDEPLRQFTDAPSAE